jgi:hypothetical protein
VKLLLDTQLLLWAAGAPKRLPAAARRVIDDPRNQPVFSATSVWEVAIKNPTWGAPIFAPMHGSCVAAGHRRARRRDRQSAADPQGPVRSHAGGPIGD